MPSFAVNNCSRILWRKSLSGITNTINAPKIFSNRTRAPFHQSVAVIRPKNTPRIFGYSFRQSHVSVWGDLYVRAIARQRATGAAVLRLTRNIIYDRPTIKNKKNHYILRARGIAPYPIVKMGEASIFDVTKFSFSFRRRKRNFFPK